EGHAPVGQVDAVESGRAGRPAVEQGGGGFSNLGPGGERAAGLLDAQRIALDGEDMQAAALGAMATPQIDQGGDVEAGAEAELGDGEIPAAAPGLGEAATGEEDRAGFRQPVLGGKIDVAIAAGAGLAGRGPDQLWVAVAGVGHRGGYSALRRRCRIAGTKKGAARRRPLSVRRSELRPNTETVRS